MPNTYTIEGLKVPQIEADVAKIREELASLRTLFNTAVEAITRLDADVAVLAEAIAAPEPSGIIPHDCGPVETCDCDNPPRYEKNG